MPFSGARPKKLKQPSDHPLQRPPGHAAISNDLRQRLPRGRGQAIGQNSRRSAGWEGRCCWPGRQLNIWRAATDNDGIKCWTGQHKKPLGRWREAGYDRLTIKPQSCALRRNADGTVTIICRSVATGPDPGYRITHRHVYTIFPSGDITVANTIAVDRRLPELPRVGVTLTMPPRFEQLEWLGRGPHESYCDRKAGAPVGLYRGTVTGQYVPYIMPQEHGNKTDVRWLLLTDNAGAGLLFVAAGLMECSASHFTADDLYRAYHTNELTPRKEVIVNLDYRQRGLGTGSCGPDTLPQYRLQPGVYRFNYRIRPFAGGENPAEFARQRIM